MNVKVKICGVRSIAAAKTALDAGADFLGFNFVPTSGRYIAPAIAEKIIRSIKDNIQIVGVFQNAEFKLVNNLIPLLGLDYVQLHGQENDHYISNVSIPVIKSITINHQISPTKAAYFLLDRTLRGKSKMVDLEKAKQIASQFPIFYAGGLNPDNVTRVVKIVRPFAVDVASGIETSGHQDLEKIKLFIRNAKAVDL